VLKLSFPQLHSFAKSDSITLRSVLQTEDFEDLFIVPLSEIAYEQFCELITYFFMDCLCLSKMISGPIFEGMTLTL
jgi:hypothetical protein